MVKKRTKRPRTLAKTDRFKLIDKELHKRTKAELIAMILALAKKQTVVARDLEDRLKIEKPMDLLIADVSSAISDATDFDERMMGDNFDVDWQAYEDVQKGFSLLIKRGHLADTKLLAIQLMKEGSYQVECSGEGLMSHDIEQCLKPVIKAVKAAGGDEASKWASEMQKADRVGFICDKELAKLRGKP